MDDITFEAEVWRHHGDSGWFFAAVPEDLSDDIDEQTLHLRRGFGSVRVQVTVGGTTWSTSLFPDTTRGCYVLPMKAEVRRREGLDAGSRCTVLLRLVDL